jgi:hypothetical protein
MSSPCQWTVVSPAGDEIDQGGHAGVPQTLVDGRVMGDQLKDLQAPKGGAQHRLRIEVLHLGRAASSIGQLFGPIALQQEQAVRLKGGLHLVEQNASQGGRGELDEDAGHHVERFDRPGPGCQVGDLEVEGHAAFLRQALCLGLRHFRAVDGQNTQALLRQPNAVSPLAIGDRQGDLPRLQPRRLPRQKGVRFDAEYIGVLRIAPVPKIIRLAHPRVALQAT